jgi:hypothetical protein
MLKTFRTSTKVLPKPLMIKKKLLFLEEDLILQNFTMSLIDEQGTLERILT